MSAAPQAAAPVAAPPAYLDLRWDENWSYLRSRALRHDYADPLKYIPLGHENWYVSMGGESRT
ncbi:MAG TPA: hypothetical protein VNH18_00500, partial [Bryobacteraceae bacterium]|nr:hypothetical protein [Bryobacteraceae bacterium]